MSTNLTKEQEFLHWLRGFLAGQTLQTAATTSISKELERVLALPVLISKCQLGPTGPTPRTLPVSPTDN